MEPNQKNSIFKKHKAISKTNKFHLLKKLKTPSRLETQPYYKKSKRKLKLNKPLRSSNEIIHKNKYFLKKNISFSKTNFTNIQKSSFLGSTLNKSQPQSDRSIQEIKMFKLSDFGLCVNVNKSVPLQFGCNTYLAPEICQLGPDNPKVRKKFNQKIDYKKLDIYALGMTIVMFILSKIY